jgi:hypothetical protein
MKIQSKLMLAIASIVLMVPMTGMSANGSGQVGMKVRGDSSDSFQRFLQEGRRPNEPLRQLGFQTKISGACAEDIVLCSFAAAGTAAACVADLWAGGALTPECIAAFNATGGACAAAARDCAGSGGGVGTPGTVRLARAGSGIIQSSDVFRELTCTAPHRVKSTRIEWANLGGPVYITKITLTCTNNVALTYGYNGTSTNTYTCSTGRLMAGLMLRTGAFVDAAGGVCRQLANNSGVTYVNGLWGGTGGTQNDRVCATGKYIVGAKMYFDGATETNRNILGIELLCK